MEFSISDDSDNSEIDNGYQEHSANGFPFCRGCSKEIFDKYYLRVNQSSWHEECLKCDVCSLNLVSEETCFIKKNKIFCKLDYYKNFGIKCAKCSRNIHSSDWVRRAKENVYHLACFACESCKRQLSTGEEFALHNNKVLCKTHYCESLDGDAGENSKSKNKRVRTTFTEEQLQVLQANFEVDSNPDGQDLERIAQITGLSKRVTQVWFQNSRARQKKYKEKKIDLNGALDLNDTDSNDDMWSSSGGGVANLADLNTSGMATKKRSSSSSRSNLTSLNYPNVYNENSFNNTVNGNNCGSINTSENLKSNQSRSSKHHKDSKTKIPNNNDMNLSWDSDDSNSNDEPNETSMYDSSLEFTHHELH